MSQCSSPAATSGVPLAWLWLKPMNGWVLVEPRTHATMQYASPAVTVMGAAVNTRPPNARTVSCWYVDEQTVVSLWRTMGALVASLRTTQAPLPFSQSSENACADAVRAIEKTAVAARQIESVRDMAPPLTTIAQGVRALAFLDADRRRALRGSR